MTRKLTPNSDADQSDGSAKRKDDKSSLERLADFTRRIVAVPKSEVQEPKRTKKPKRRKA